MTNKCLDILAECLFAFRFCSFLHIHSPLAGIEFNRLVLSDLQILDSQGRLPRGRASFLGPELLQTKTLSACCVLLMLNTVDIVHWKVNKFCSRCRQERKTEEKVILILFSFLFFFYPTAAPLQHTATHGNTLFLFSGEPAVYFQTALDSSNIFSKAHTCEFTCVPIYTDTPGMHSWKHTYTNTHTL